MPPPAVLWAAEGWLRHAGAQVWELDTSLLRRHAMPLLHAHANETATTITAFDMDPRPVEAKPAA